MEQRNVPRVIGMRRSRAIRAALFSGFLVIPCLVFVLLHGVGPDKRAVWICTLSQGARNMLVAMEARALEGAVRGAEMQNVNADLWRLIDSCSSRAASRALSFAVMRWPQMNAQTRNAWLNAVNARLEQPGGETLGVCDAQLLAKLLLWRDDPLKNELQLVQHVIGGTRYEQASAILTLGGLSRTGSLPETEVIRLKAKLKGHLRDIELEQACARLGSDA